ncbi:MAG: hypothetical protein V4530_05945 [Pseudomonadota bacterium]
MNDLPQEVDDLLAEYPGKSPAEIIAGLRRNRANLDWSGEEVDAVIGELEGRAG